MQAKEREVGLKEKKDIWINKKKNKAFEILNCVYCKYIVTDSLLITCNI